MRQSLVKGVFVTKVIPQNEAKHQENIVVQEANEKFIKFDLVDNRNVLTVL